MNRPPHRLGLLLAGACAATLAAAPLPTETTEAVKDRAGFIPFRKYEALPGKAVGVLVGDAAPMMNQEGRSGPPDAMGFSRNGGSYRWVYVPAEAEVLIQNLTVRVGEKGDQTRVYPKLNMARPVTVKMWDIDVPVCLVEADVNDLAGAPPDEGFVATRMRRLDGTAAFPAKLPDVVAEARRRHALFAKEQQPAVEAAFAEAVKGLQGKKMTGPRESADLFYVTYLAEKERVRVTFRTTLTDGAYQVGPGGALRDPRLPPLDRPDRRPFFQGPQAEQPARRPPPPLRFENVRWGTQVAVEYGVAYEVTKNGKIDRVLILPPLAKVTELPPPPGAGPRGPGRIDDLPAQPIRPGLDR